MMLAILSNGEVQAVDVVKWLVVLGFLLGIYMKIRAWEKGVRGDGTATEIVKQPLRVQWEKEFVARPDFERALETLHGRVTECAEDHTRGDLRLENDIKRLGGKLDEFRQEITTEASRRAASIHSRVDDMGKTLSAVEERATTANARLSQLDQKMDRLLERFSLSTATTTQSKR